MTNHLKISDCELNEILIFILTTIWLRDCVVVTILYWKFKLGCVNNAHTFSATKILQHNIIFSSQKYLISKQYNINNYNIKYIIIEYKFKKKKKKNE